MRDAVGEVRNPLYRSGYALVVNTIGSTMIGVVYWAVAAHLYSRQVVGQASALVTCLVLVTHVAQLNLHNSFPKFLPRTGARVGRFIGYGYAASSAVALACGLAVVTVMPAVSSQWHFLSNSLALSAEYVAASVAWVVFTLEDAVLLGLQHPVVVPAENTTYGIAKLALLPGTAARLSATSLFMSWIAPLAAVIPAINWLIFRRYVPALRGARTDAKLQPREVIRFSSIDYLGGLIGQAYWNVLPLLVLSVLGATANGSFYIAWTLSGGLGLVAVNFATGLLVEGSAAPDRLAQLTRGVVARSLLITGSGGAVLGLSARPILTIYGREYAARASTLLGLLAAGTVLFGLTQIAFSLDRIAGSVERATWTRAALAVLVLGGSALLLRRLGIVGVGYSWLTANVVIALARAPTIVAVLRSQPASAHGRVLHRNSAAGGIASGNGKLAQRIHADPWPGGKRGKCLCPR